MIRVLMTELTPGAAEGIRAVLCAREEIEVVGYARDGLEAAQMAVQLRPDVMLVHDELPEMPGTLACELTALAAPEVACALICDHADPPTIKRAMLSGARMVVSPATSPEELATAMRELAALRRRLSEPEYALVTDPAAMPVTIATLAARDGVGKSTLTVNLAAVLAQRYPNKVVIVDLCGQFGSAALLLNIRPTHTIVDLAGYALEMDLELLETFLEPHPSGVQLLAGGTRPDPSWTDALSVEFIASVLALLRRRFKYVICDVPALIWPGSLYVISRAQHCLVVTTLSDVTGVREVAALMDALVPAHVPADRLRLVVNKLGNQDWFSEEDVKTATKREVWHTVPSDAANLMAATREGTPVVSSRPAAPVAKAIAAMADKLAKLDGASRVSEAAGR